MPSLLLSASSPPAFAVDVSESSTVTVAVTADAAVIDTLTVSLDGVVAYTRTGSGNTFTYPAFFGVAIVTDDRAVVSVEPRRKFVPGSTTTVRVEGTTLAGGPTLDASQVFYVAERRTSVRDASLYDHRVGAAFNDQPALDTLRERFGSAARRRDVPYIVAAYDRVRRSQLVSLLFDLDLPGNLAEEADRLQAADLADVIVVDARLTELDLLWGSALNELRSLDASDGFVDLLAKAHEGRYPQERVAAVALAILYAATVLV
jgi:hypothetical protein